MKALFARADLSFPSPLEEAAMIQTSDEKFNFTLWEGDKSDLARQLLQWSNIWSIITMIIKSLF